MSYPIELFKPIPPMLCDKPSMALYNKLKKAKKTDRDFDFLHLCCHLNAFALVWNWDCPHCSPAENLDNKKDTARFAIETMHWREEKVKERFPELYPKI